MTSKTPIARLVARLQQQENVESSVSPEALQEFLTSAFAKRSCGECLALSEFEWMAEVPTKSYEECSELIKLISSLILPEMKTALSLFEDSQWTSTGLDVLDESLHGGIRYGHLTELVGRAGVGKTQFCMTIGSKVAAKKRGVIYLDSERRFLAERFLEIIHHYGGEDSDVHRVKMIRVEDFSFSKLFATIKSLESTLLSENVGLFILDSATAVARVESCSVIERQSNLAKLATMLKELSETYRIPVLVTNQATGSFQQEITSVEKQQFSAALGNTWHHVVNVRLFLSTESGENRTIRVMKSPDSIDSTCFYSITSRGIVAEESSQKQDILKDWGDVFSKMSREEFESL